MSSDVEFDKLEKEVSNEENKRNKALNKVNDLSKVNSNKQKDNLKVQKAQVDSKMKKGTKVDIYLETTEKKYHNYTKMQSATVLDNEMEVCDKIIKFKQDNNFDDDDIWESKKSLVEITKNKLVTFIENGAMDIEDYKKTIQTELAYEKQLLDLVKKDKMLKVYENEELISRIKKRIQLIENELAEEIDEDDKEEGEDPKKTNLSDKGKEKPKESNTKKSDNKPTQVKPVDTKINKEVTNVVPSPKKVIRNNYVDQAKLKHVRERFEEYMMAINYLKENNCDSLLKEAILKAKEIKDAEKLIESGRSDEVEEYSYPGKLTPSIICGCSEQERVDTYNEIISEYSLQSEVIKTKMDAILDKIKKEGSPNQQKKMIDEVKNELDRLKSQKEKLGLIIQKLKENLNNPWVPAALFSFTIDEEIVEKVNDEIPSKALSIYLGKTTYLKSSLYAVLKVDNKIEEIKQKSSGNFDKSAVIDFELNDFKYLHRKTLEIEIRKRK